jgi:hypothetical protein
MMAVPMTMKVAMMVTVMMVMMPVVPMIGICLAGPGEQSGYRQAGGKDCVFHGVTPSKRVI